MDQEQSSREELRDLKLKDNILKEGKSLFADKLVEKIVYSGLGVVLLTVLGIILSIALKHAPTTP